MRWRTRTRVTACVAAAAAVMALLPACDESGGSVSPPRSVGSTPMVAGAGALMPPPSLDPGQDACTVGQTRSCACAAPNMEGVQECIFDFSSPTSGVFAECKDCVAVEPRADSCTMGMTRQCTCDNGEAGTRLCVFDRTSPTQGTFSACGACRADDFDGGV